jgi:retinol dehydrogenase-12
VNFSSDLFIRENPTKMPSALSIIFPPSPKFTDANLPSLAGKVFIVTGAASGVGFELAKILYAAGGVVYIAARSVARCTGAVEKIKSEVGYGKTSGRLENMVIDLANLETVRRPIEEFLQKEIRLDILVHNAGVMTPPAGSKDALVRALSSIHLYSVERALRSITYTTQTLGTRS